MNVLVNSINEAPLLGQMWDGARYLHPIRSNLSVKCLVAFGILKTDCLNVDRAIDVGVVASVRRAEVAVALANESHFEGNIHRIPIC